MSKKNRKLRKLNFRDIDRPLENPVPIKPKHFSTKIRCKKCGNPSVLSIKMEDDGVINIYFECPFCRNEEVLYSIEDYENESYFDDDNEIIEEFLKENSDELTEEEEKIIKQLSKDTI